MNQMPIEGRPATLQEQNLLQIEYDWLKNTASLYRDTARSSIAIAGLLIGFYSMMVSTRLSASPISSLPDPYVRKVVVFLPMALLLVSLCISLIQIRPYWQILRHYPEDIRQKHDRLVWRLRVLNDTSLVFLLFGLAAFCVIFVLSA